jgi:hypothetical protein
MSDAFMRKGTWAGVAVVAFAAGVGIVRVASGSETRAALAEPPTHDVVSRAHDSEMEVSPVLAAQRDGTLALAWIATAGGRDGSGRYVGVRVSDPNAGKLGALMRIRGDLPISDLSIVALGDAFFAVFRGGENVYSARVSREGVSEPKVIAKASRVRAAVATNGVLVVAMAAKEKFSIATSKDGVTFASRDVGASPQSGETRMDAISDPPLATCADEHVALVAWVEDVSGSRSVHAARVALDSDASSRVNVSNIGEHVASDAPTCFIAGEDAFIVYGLRDKPQDDAENAVASSLVFARSKDSGNNFLLHTPYRPPTRVLHPTVLHDPSSFTLLGVMGSGLGDAHASVSVIKLGADGRMQNGLTETVIAPVTMNVARDAGGYMGDSLGIVTAAGATWTAVVDNATGESHVALVRVL